MKNFTLSVAEGKRQEGSNKIYSTHAVITSVEELCKAVQFDHMAGLFRNDTRANENFIQADALMMDCDNDSTDDSAMWLTPEKFSERLQGVPFYAVYSRNNMKEKEGKAPRPKWHVYLPLSETITEGKQIRDLKECLLAVVPEFDKGAKDTARQFFGVENPQAVSFEGDMFIDEFITINGIKPKAKPKQETHGQEQESTENDGQHEQQGDTITQGDRHNTLVTTAVEALSKYGEEKAHTLFLKAAERCKPPKPVAEVNAIWEWALSKHKEFKAKFAVKYQTLTLPILEQTLKALNISVRFDVITKQIEVSDLPADNPYMPEAYRLLTGSAKRNANIELLPLFLESYFKDKQFKFGRDFLSNSISAIANANRFNPVLDLIQATQWDGHDRINDLEILLGIKENHYQCVFLQKWLLQTLVLAGNDEGDIGLEFVLVLQGGQGGGKTSVFRKLAIRQEWFAEGLTIDTTDKDSLLKALCVWIAECGELDATAKKEQASLKSFLTANTDMIRRPYARKAESMERRTSFCGTVNPQQVNRDTTGSRRFVYIHVEDMDKHFIHNIMTPEWCTQLWRQVYDTLYQACGRNGYRLTHEEMAYSEAVNEDFRVLRPAETELLDLLDWDSDTEFWQWRNASEVKDSCEDELKRFDAKTIGEALTSISKRFSACQKRISRGRTQYFVPKKQ